MCPDPLKLLGWKVPPTRHRYSRRDTAFYALSLGVGSDAGDRRQIALVDPWNERLQALPSMALILGYPGFWLGESKVMAVAGVGPWQILHAEQFVLLEGPLPVEGTVVGETRVTGLVDKGAERGSFLHSERAVFDERTGQRVATCTQVHFIRKVGGCGSAGDPVSLWRKAPELGAARTVVTPTLDQQALLYRLKGDANALHSDPEAATKAGFQRPILHGMCSAGMAVTAVVAAQADFDPARVRAFGVRMSSPVLPGDTLRTEIWTNGAFRTRVLERDVLVLDDGFVQLTES